MAYEYLRAARNDGRVEEKRADAQRAVSNLPVLDEWIRRAERNYATRATRAPARFRAPAPIATPRGLYPDAPRRARRDERARENIRTQLQLYYLVTDPSCDAERSGLYAAMIFDTTGARKLWTRFRAEQARILLDRARHGAPVAPVAAARPHRALSATIGERIRARIG